MIHRMLPRAAVPICLFLAALWALGPGPAGADDLLPVEYDREEGKVLLSVAALDEPMIYTNTLATGLGSTSPLLDRGQIGESTIVRFERRGPKVLLIRDNTKHRALTDNGALRRSVAQSFPRSVLAAMEIVDDNGGVLVVDATDFVLSDVFDVTGQIKAADQGKVELDRDRSYLDLERTGAFPENTELRAVLSFTSDEPGEAVRTHAPDGRSFTIAQHHSFRALPDDGYRPRAFHPRAGIFPHVFFDFARGLDTDYRQRWIWRWRLVPSDKEAYLAGELVEPEEPIVYYLDPGIPEPYRSAFIEGGLWWNKVFEKAGFRDAFQIRDLPDGVDPMDARYSVIHWVHRRERGPSIGPHYRDPRTGEIINVVVRMDSFRSLVNHDIWMGFRPAAGEGELALDSEEMAMARRRQHSAHEIGHTLGLAHNFIAASHGRASVMDYPVPLVKLDGEGRLDISDAYRPSHGLHDELAIRYAYTWYPDAESERKGLEAIIREMDEAGLRFITGDHAAPGGSHPDATTWVEGEDMREALERTMAVRRVLIDAFDERALNDGEPYSLLNKRFAHVYLHHRSALHGVTKHVGGMEFRYALKGEDIEVTKPVPAQAQKEALDLLMKALQPEALHVPDRVAELIPPAPLGWDQGWGWQVNETLIESPAGPMFEPVTVAHSLAQEIVDNLLRPERMARVASQHARDRSQPGPADVLEALVEATWRDSGGTHPELHRVVQRAVLDSMLDLAGGETTVSEVRAAVEARLEMLADEIRPGRLPSVGSANIAEFGHRKRALRDIERYFDGEDDPEKRPRPEPISLPWP